MDYRPYAHVCARRVSAICENAKCEIFRISQSHFAKRSSGDRAQIYFRILTCEILSQLRNGFRSCEMGFAAAKVLRTAVSAVTAVVRKRLGHCTVVRHCTVALRMASQASDGISQASVGGGSPGSEGEPDEGEPDRAKVGPGRPPHPVWQ